MTALILLVFAAVYLGVALGRAREAGAELSFVEHARCGIPITLLSFALALVWLVAMGYAAP